MTAKTRRAYYQASLGPADTPSSRSATSPASAFQSEAWERGGVGRLRFIAMAMCSAIASAALGADAPDLIVDHAKIVMVDDRFSIQEAMAIRDGRIVAVGTSAEVLNLKDEHTRVADLAGRMVLPGLMDSHT